MGKIIKLTALLFLLSACTNPEENTREEFSLQGSWKVLKINDNPVPEDLMITLNIDSTWRVNGKSACNSYFGNIKKEKDSLSFSQLGMTRMLCDEEKNKWENNYTSSLTKRLKITPAGSSSFTLTNEKTTIELKKNSPTNSISK